MVISRSEDGEGITLDEVSDIERQPAASSVERIDGQHACQYELQLETGANLSEAVVEMQDIVTGLELCPGINFSFTGDQELIQDSAMDMLMAIVLAVVLVVLVMAAQFESFKYPFVIMATIPPSAIGVMLGLWATHTPLSVRSEERRVGKEC